MTERFYNREVFFLLALFAILQLGAAIIAPFAGDTLYSFQHFFCHQTPEKSFFLFDNHQMGLCSRCIGLYSGILVSFSFFYLAEGSRSFQIAYQVSFVLLGVFVCEKIIFHITGSDSSNLVRLLIGIGLGTWLGFTTNWLLKVR